LQGARPGAKVVAQEYQLTSDEKSARQAAAKAQAAAE
jgi:hypothetical protein